MRYRSLFAGLLVNSLVAVAQVGSGPGIGMGLGSGNSTDPSANYMQMFQNMGSVPMMGSGMGVGMTEDLAVSPDGTAYVIRSVATSSPISSNTWQFELTAITPMDGSVKWTLPIPGGRASSPVLATDGLIYVSVDNYQMFYANFASGGSMMTQDQALANYGKLLVIAATDRSAAILHTIQTASDVLSIPRTVTDPSGGYLIYVLGYDMMSWTSMPASGSTTFGPGEKTLYAYRPDGSLKFSVKLSQTGNGMMRP